MQAPVPTERRLLDTVRFAVEQARLENSKERNKLEMLIQNGTSEQLHRLEHSLERESHLLLTMLWTLLDYQRAVAKSLALRSSLFQERALSGKSENDQAHDPVLIVACSQCGAEVEQHG